MRFFWDPVLLSAICSASFGSSLDPENIALGPKIHSDYSQPPLQSTLSLNAGSLCNGASNESPSRPCESTSVACPGTPTMDFVQDRAVPN
ncbi:hypothetical protein DFH06DRAFT_1184191 [Mycena polygramma]|nr:hypothetical protein DFH06DRAFT_1184191 [Mycena polygramma]